MGMLIVHCNPLNPYFPRFSQLFSDVVLPDTDRVNMCISSPGVRVPQALFCCSLPAASQLSSCRSCQGWCLGLAAVPLPVFSLGESTSRRPVVQSQTKHKLSWTHAYPVPRQCGGTSDAKRSGSFPEEISQVHLLLVGI